jgi:hypothetical protein
VQEKEECEVRKQRTDSERSTTHSAILGHILTREGGKEKLDVRRETERERERRREGPGRGNMRGKTPTGNL